MKWIKLFEAFTTDDKTQAINELFMSFFITRILNAMDLKKIQTRNYIYFYRTGDSTELEFVFSKEINLLHYPQNKVEQLSEVIPFSISPVSNSTIHQDFKRISFLNDLVVIFRKLLKDHLSQYINFDNNVETRISVVNSRGWTDLKNNFKKLKEG